jgi:hypothetical protein
MKRLMLLTMVAAVTIAAAGCGCWERWRRGPHCETCPSTGPAPCGPYSSSYGGGVVPAAPNETYLPAPG